jgi:hypothetical protein
MLVLMSFLLPVMTGSSRSAGDRLCPEAYRIGAARSRMTRA